MKTENIILIIIMLFMCVICVGSVVAHDMSFTKTDNMSYNLIAHNDILTEIDNSSDISLNGFNYLLSWLPSLDCTTNGTSLINLDGELTKDKLMGNLQLIGENNTVDNSTDKNSTTITVDELAHNLCKGTTTDKEKATVLFNYVRDNIDYEFYYNSRYFPQGTLDHGAGNCCDQARLYVAMCEAVGLTTNYVHGDCCFKADNQTYGYVWSQVSIDGQKFTADPTSYLNTFGNVTSWDLVRIIKEYEPGDDLGF